MVEIEVLMRKKPSYGLSFYAENRRMTLAMTVACQTSFSRSLVDDAYRAAQQR